MTNEEIKLGMKLKDTVSGFTGTVWPLKSKE